MKSKVIVFLLFIFLISCKDEFLLESQGFKPFLVVDGMITNEAPPYTVNLSISSPANTKEFFPLQNCEVIIIDNLGEQEILTETEAGKYVTSTTGIQGTIGITYKLTIKTPDGRNYETAFQEMKQTFEIESLYAEIMYKEVLGYPFGLPGFLFYTSTKTAPNKDSYILWNLIETYEYSADYFLHSILTEDGYKYVDIDTNDIFNDVHWCWKTLNTGYRATGKTSNLDIPKINDHPLIFVGTDSRKLTKRYSLLLKQYSLTKEAYNFWNSVEEQVSQENFLIATQPYNIIGNVYNIDDQKEIVYGYFTVASIDQKRIFINRPNNAFYYDLCLVDLEPPHNSNYYVFSKDGKYGSVEERCLDCTSRGGVLTKPDFWIDF